MRNTKIKAFTLSEMIVVLVVASIVISMGFLVLNMVRKQVRVIRANYQNKHEVQLFQTIFTRDFNRRSAVYDNKKNILKLKNTKDNISYAFMDSIIIREIDTFKIAIANKKLFLNGFEVKNKSIDAIQIILSKQYSDKELFIQKTKDGAFYMNNEYNK
jgi:prepilin-type N-terminal cleavage/methylation domain-containing protein